MGGASGVGGPSVCNCNARALLLLAKGAPATRVPYSGFQYPNKRLKSRLWLWRARTAGLKLEIQTCTAKRKTAGTLTLTAHKTYSVRIDHNLSFTALV